MQDRTSARSTNSLATHGRTIQIRVSRRSVACRSSSHFLARSLASAGLRQATSRSPGKSGELISARSRSSNRESCNGPVSAASTAICGALRQLIQSSPAGANSSVIRAEVLAAITEWRRVGIQDPAAWLHEQRVHRPLARHGQPSSGSAAIRDRLAPRLHVRRVIGALRRSWLVRG
jgi:hypothetical protein